MKKKMFGKALAVILAVAMCVSLLPLSALAENGGAEAPVTVTFQDVNGDQIGAPVSIAEAGESSLAAPEGYADAKWGVVQDDAVTPLSALPALADVTEDMTIQRIPAQYTVGFFQEETSLCGPLVIAEGDSLAAVKTQAENAAADIEGFTGWTYENGQNVDFDSLPLEGYADKSINLFAKVAAQNSGGSNGESGEGGAILGGAPAGGEAADEDPVYFSITLQYEGETLFPGETIRVQADTSGEAVIGSLLNSYVPAVPADKTSFKGWSRNPGGELFDLSTPISGDITLHAQFNATYRCG